MVMILFVKGFALLPYEVHKIILLPKKFFEKVFFFVVGPSGSTVLLEYLDGVAFIHHYFRTTRLYQPLFLLLQFANIFFEILREHFIKKLFGDRQVVF